MLGLKHPLAWFFVSWAFATLAVLCLYILDYKRENFQKRNSGWLVSLLVPHEIPILYCNIILGRLKIGVIEFFCEL